MTDTCAETCGNSDGQFRPSPLPAAATVNMDSAYTDPELHDWLAWAEEHGSNFMRALAEAALVANIKHFNLLRPVLLKVKEEES